MKFAKIFYGIALTSMLGMTGPVNSEPKLESKSDQLDLDNAPTFINSDSLTLKSAERIFEYSGKVEVKHGDLTLNSDNLLGHYDEKNQITDMIAKSNVLITKGEKIRATSQKAVYDKASDTLTLTENPQVEQEGSLLNADVIKILLKENRSIAEGSVRVKLLSEGDEAGKETKLIR